MVALLPSAWQRGMRPAGTPAPANKKTPCRSTRTELSQLSKPALHAAIGPLTRRLKIEGRFLRHPAKIAVGTQVGLAPLTSGPQKGLLGRGQLYQRRGAIPRVPKARERCKRSHASRFRRDRAETGELDHSQQCMMWRSRRSSPRESPARPRRRGAAPAPPFGPTLVTGPTTPARATHGPGRLELAPRLRPLLGVLTRCR